MTTDFKIKAGLLSCLPPCFPSKEPHFQGINMDTIITFHFPSPSTSRRLSHDFYSELEFTKFDIQKNYSPEKPRVKESTDSEMS